MADSGNRVAAAAENALIKALENPPASQDEVDRLREVLNIAKNYTK